MPLSDFANVTITAETAQVLQAGFGVPLILSANTPAEFGSDRIRYYGRASEMVEDGWDAESAEVAMATVLFSQETKPSQVAIGRRANKPTQSFRLTPVVANSETYGVRILEDANTVEYTADASATAAEIVAGLKGVIDGLGLDLTTTTGATYLDVVADTAGDWFSVESSDPAKLKVAQTHADPGLSADLTAIATVDSTWYAILNLFNSKAEVEAIATWAEANEKTFIAQVQDTVVIKETYVAASNSDTGTRLKDLGDVRTKLVYHPATDAFLDAAEAGLLLPKQPGSETWHAKQIRNVPVVKLTSTDIVNLKAKNVGWLYSVSGLNVTAQGKTSSGNYYDEVRGRDWLKARLGERIFRRIGTSDKIPFTDDGIAVVVAEVRAQLQEAVEVGLIAPDSWTVTYPKASEVSDANKAARTLTGVEFTAVLAGAIHSVTINGVVSLT